MKSGLYACAGASATARAAACAKRFDDPITNESNVYFGFMPSSGWRLGATAMSAGRSPRSIRVRRIRRSCPLTSLAAAWISPRKCASIHSRVKSFGTPMTNVSSDRSAPSASANHVRYVVSLSAPLSRPATSDHRLDAVGSIWRFTRRLSSFSGFGRRRAYQRPGVADTPFGGGSCKEKRCKERTFSTSPKFSTPVDHGCCADPCSGRFGYALADAPELVRTVCCGQRTKAALVYTGSPRPALRLHGRLSSMKRTHQPNLRRRKRRHG